MTTSALFGIFDHLMQLYDLELFHSNYNITSHEIERVSKMHVMCCSLVSILTSDQKREKV